MCGCKRATVQFIICVSYTCITRLLPPPRRLCFRRCLFVFCSLATLRKNFGTDLHEIFRKGWQWANEQMIKFWWRSRSPSGYRDCFPDSSILGDTESGINRLRYATLQCSSVLRIVQCDQGVKSTFWPCEIADGGVGHLDLAGIAMATMT